MTMLWLLFAAASFTWPRMSAALTTVLAVPFWMVVWPFVPVEGVLSVPEDGASLVPEPPPLGVELVMVTSIWNSTTL